jgi:hypothetical protein
MGSGTAFTSLQPAIASELLMKVVQVYISVYSPELNVDESVVRLGTFDNHVATSGVQSRPPAQKRLW